MHTVHINIPLGIHIPWRYYLHAYPPRLTSLGGKLPFLDFTRLIGLSDNQYKAH